MCFKLVSKSVKFLDGVIMTDMTPSVFPDLLLRIEVRRAWGKAENFNCGMVGQALANG
jgi:hypothetical protein